MMREIKVGFIGAGAELDEGRLREVVGADEDDLFAYEGTLAMHEHFFECVRKGETPCGDIRDVIHTSRLVDRLERFRRVVIGGS